MSHIACAVIMTPHASMTHAAHIVCGHRPDVVVLLGSHTRTDCLVSESVGTALPSAHTFATLVDGELRYSGLHVEQVANLDVGPPALEALAAAGWRGRTLALAIPEELFAEDVHTIGHTLGRVARGSGKRWALVVTSEDVARDVACAATGVSRVGLSDYARILYEESVHPHAWHFGGHEPFVSAIATAAREAMAATLAGATYQPEIEGGEPRYGVIVSLRDANGHIRGARGILGDTRRSLVDQVVAAASSLPESSKPPLDVNELPTLAVELTLMCKPEPVDKLDLLDPSRYGVIVEQDGRRSMLPPRVPGIETALDQVMSACQSAEVDLRRPFEIFRFDVDNVSEPVAHMSC